ncbi:MAG TPA: ATP-dependent DNA helicase [Solirubrobacteraceae bacterium]|jgi:DNA helicase-2/ATP-dependent DNA helicase PcrA|nr:ATP-dependent DNA helicase [Solirubrobacteraceae bacterium]
MPNIDDVLRSELTPAQLAAATDPTAEVLALACAGSGKSRTLAYRVAWLLANGAKPESIIAFTFTEKAAESIKLRIGNALIAVGLEPTVLGAMFVGTIHGWCKGVLGEMDARYRQFEVLDDNRLKLFLISRAGQLGLYDRLQETGRGRYFQIVHEVTNAWKLLNDEMLDLDDVERLDNDLGAVLRELDAVMDRDCFIDFSLMIRRVADALTEGNEVACGALATLRHLHVDEYQDINPAQEALIRAMHGLSETLFVCGDDDQAVYAWRGADVSNILEFASRYPQASEHTLARNFRSTPAIVDAADAFVVAELGPLRLPKEPEADPTEQPRDFRRVWFTDRAQEAEWVGDRIQALLGTGYEEKDGRIRGLTPADVAVLMRSTSESEQTGSPRHAAFTAALNSRGIAYTLEAGGSVFDRPQAEVLREAFELLRSGPPSRPDARERFDSMILPAYPNADFNAFVRVLAQWGREIHGPAAEVGAARRRVYPQQLVHDLLEAFGIRQTAFDPGTMRDIGSFSRMIQDAESVYLSIDSAGRFGQILNFLQQVARYGYDTGTDDLIARPDAVTVSTVHRVKGLEFPAVFIADVENQRFPKRRGKYKGWLPLELVQPALGRGAYQSTPEEEARLFYTAMTRAERYLQISGSAQLPGGRRPAQPSRYAQRLSGDELADDPDGEPEGLVPATPSRRIDETVLPTTYSDIRYYLGCPRDYLLRKSYGFSPPITDLFGFGLTVHAGLGKLHERFPQRAPDPDEAGTVAEETFHLKHVPASRDPERPGPYERARDSAVEILRTYADSYGSDFARTRKVEARFEIPVRDAVISGSIDLMLRENENGEILDAEVVDFKSMKGGDEPELNPALDWTELALQVQLYAKAAREVLGEAARTGSVHLLKDNKRISVPVGDEAVDAAIANIEWAVARILEEDFPMRPHPDKCSGCDFRSLCPKVIEEFQTDNRPPPLQIPADGAGQFVSAFEVAPVEGI